MKLTIKNLGAVSEGSIDLSKKFNLLCGPNGTGKTYFAYVVYGLLRNILHMKGDMSMVDDLLTKRTLDVAIDWQLLLKYRSSMRDSLISGLDDLFGLGEMECKKIFEDFDISYADSDEEFIQTIRNGQFDIIEKIGSVQVEMAKQTGSEFVRLTIKDETIAAESITNLRLMLPSIFFYNLTLAPIRSVVMFPVERNSIYTFSKELSIRKQEAMDNIQMIVDKDKKFDALDILFNSKRYPQPIKDGLVIADDLVERKKFKSEFYEFAEQLEKDLLKGKVQISNEGDIQFKPAKSPRKILPIQMTASIIKTMASLVVYLKHIARKNDLIIIDEPEINLHPDNQIVLAQFLAKLMNHGFRLMVSTHSDYVIREINNLVMMSHTDCASVQEIAKTKGYTSDMFIKEDDLSVLYFNYKKKSAKTTEVESLAVDQFGFEVESIDEVIEEQSDLAENLYYALKLNPDAK